MPTGHRRRKEARPAEILAAALAEFSKQGFAATRLDDVAQRAGITKGTIYLYFDSKEALFRALLQQEAGRTFDLLEAMMASHDGPVAPLLRQLIHTAGRQLVQSDLRALIWLLISEGPRFPDLLAFHHGEVIRRGRALLASLVERGIERGEFRANGLAEYPQIVVGGPMLALLWTQLFARFEPLDLEAYLDVFADTLLEGLLSRAEPSSC